LRIVVRVTKQRILSTAYTGARKTYAVPVMYVTIESMRRQIIKTIRAVFCTYSLERAFRRAESSFHTHSTHTQRERETRDTHQLKPPSFEAHPIHDSIHDMTFTFRSPSTESWRSTEKQANLLLLDISASKWSRSQSKTTLPWSSDSRL
jgi:hypothetical protein